MKTSLLLSAPILAIGLIACQKNPVESAKSAINEPEMMGKVFRSCSDDTTKGYLKKVAAAFASGFQVASVEEQYEFSPSGVTHRTILYPEGGCQGQALGTLIKSGTHDLGTGEQLEDGARQVNFNYSNLRVTIQSAQGREAANSQKLCGIGEWKEGEEHDVTGRAGDCLSDLYQNENWKNQYSVYRFNNEQSTLRLSQMATNENKRVKGLEGGQVFKAKDGQAALMTEIEEDTEGEELY